MKKTELIEKAKVLFNDNKGLEEVWMCSDGVGYNDQHNACQYQKTINKQEEPILIKKKELKKLQADATAEAKAEAEAAKKAAEDTEKRAKELEGKE